MRETVYKRFVKRWLDVVLSLSLVIASFPVLAFITIVIKLTSRGPALFKQARVGKNGEPFTILKFRTMRVDRDAERKGFEPGDANRITGIGKILRKSKMDELPQLFNVLRGDMSLVGPRPEVAPYVELYPERWREVHTVPPGITDPASIEYRDEETLLAAADDPEREYREVILPRKLDIYERYVENVSLAIDAAALRDTFLAILFR